MPQLMVPQAVLGENEKFLIYGDFGTGKTFTALTAPDPIWAIGVGGANEFKTRYSKQFLKKVGRKEIYLDTVREERGTHGQTLDNPRGFDNFCDVIDAGLEFNDKEGGIFKSLIIDNATILEQYQMSKAIAAEFATAGNAEKTTLAKERDYGIRKPGDNTYGGAQSLMDNIVSWLFELPFHIVFVAHEYKTFRPASPGSRDRILTSVAPLFVGQQRTSVPNKFDNVWRATASGGGRSQTFDLQTVGDEIISAKTRVGGFLNPTNERDVNLTEVIAEFKEHADNLTEND